MIIVELLLRIIKFDYIDGQYWEQKNTFVGIKAKYLYITYICMYFFGRKMTSLVEYNNWYYMLKLSFENYEINFVYFLTLISWYNLMI